MDQTEDFIEQLMARAEYNIAGYVIGTDITLYVTQFNEFQKEIPETIGGKPVLIVQTL